MYGNYPNAQQANPHHPQFLQQPFQPQHPPQQLTRDESLFKLKRLDEINNNIARISSSLIVFFDELTKDKQPSTKIKQSKIIFDEFLKHLRKVESDLLNEISNLTMASTGHQHEGSIYGARKDYDLAKMQIQLIAAQLNSLRESLNSPLQALNKDDTSDED
jgi:hypothetical protein